MTSLRFMRILVLFDLPVETPEEKRSYRKFRKALMKNGFIMLQESVYCKLITTPTVEESVRNLIRNNKPEKGLVQTITITEKQFQKMEYIVGEYKNETICTEESVVIL